MTDPVTRAVSPDQQPVVSRELLAQMDEAATSKQHWKILIASGMGFFTDAYDLFIIGVVATMVTKEWHIASYQKSLLSSLALLTSAAGAVFFGRIADKLGRRKIYGYEVLVLAVGAIATAFAPSIWWLIALRGILGFGIGGDYPVSATIMSEYAGRRHRGRMVALVFSMQGLGLVAGVSVLGLLATLILLPEPKGQSLETLNRASSRAARWPWAWRKAAGPAHPAPDHRCAGPRLPAGRARGWRPSRTSRVPPGPGPSAAAGLTPVAGRVAGVLAFRRS